MLLKETLEDGWQNCAPKMQDDFEKITHVRNVWPCAESDIMRIPCMIDRHRYARK